MRLRTGLVVFCLACALLPVVVIVTLLAVGQIEADAFVLVIIVGALLTLPIALYLVARHTMAVLRQPDLLVVDRARGALRVPRDDVEVPFDAVQGVVMVEHEVTRRSPGFRQNASHTYAVDAAAWSLLIARDGGHHQHAIVTVEAGNGDAVARDCLQALAAEFGWPRIGLALGEHGTATRLDGW